ncbi:hypothetical protein ES702_02613 [subsurface metagenome]
MSKLGRPLKYGEKMVVATVKVPESRRKEIQEALPDLVEQYIEEISIDTEILKKMIPVFIENKIEIELEDNEIERIKQLYEVIKSV